jgi:hypothetical protein
MTRPSVLPSVKTTTSAPELIQAFAAQWLACVLPCRRFACTLAGADARLGADVDRYSFIVEDLHHLLLAGLTGAPKFLTVGMWRYHGARCRAAFN